jgi:uncharacterized protein (DUF305 family)
MKHYLDQQQLKIKVLVLMVLFIHISGASIAQKMSMSMPHHAEPAGRNIFLKMMDSMMVNMDQAPKADSPGADFLQQMLPHHQGAIMMAKYELKHGRNAAMIQLAKSILAEQQTEIQQMNLLLKEPAELGKAGAAYRSAMAKTMNQMMEHLPAAKSLSDTDRAFAAVMLPHHQAAVDMAKVVLRFSKNEHILAFAKQLISNQQVEIEQMSDYLN